MRIGGIGGLKPSLTVPVFLQKSIPAVGQVSGGRGWTPDLDRDADGASAAVHGVLPSGTTGKATSNVEPLGLASARTRLPACLSTIVRQIARPNPIPARLVVKNASNMRLWSCGWIPAPVSWTDRRTYEFSPSRVLTFNRRSPTGTEFKASIAFLIKFKITCCNCAGSALTEGGAASNSVTTDISLNCSSCCSNRNTCRATSSMHIFVG